MSVNEFIVFSERVIVDDEIVPATVFSRTGRITDVIRGDAARSRATVDVGRLVLMPGVVDTHVHVNEPGRTEWEGFETAGKAAAAGGVTTMVVMPLNCDPVATTVAALREEAAAAKSCRVDYGFWGGVVPGNADELEGLWKAGVLGFKCFMVESGIEEFANVTEGELDRAMGVLGGFGASEQGGAVLLAHAEDAGTIARAWESAKLSERPRSYGRYLASRPAGAEEAAIAAVIRVCEKHRDRGARAHIVHLATASAVDMLRAARGRGVAITVETCPHYLALAAEEIADGDTLCKCAPPIRDAANRERLWKGLREGDIDLIASDHSPCPPEMKKRETGDFAVAWGGIASLQLALPVVWTEASRRGFSITDVARWMCEAPARLAGLDGRKGRIAVGYDADLVVWDAEEEFVVDAGKLEHRHKITPYDGKRLRGVVKRTFVRGDLAFDAGEKGPKRFPEGVRGGWVTREDKKGRSRS